MTNRLKHLPPPNTDPRDLLTLGDQRAWRRYFDQETLLKLPARFWRRAILRAVLFGEQQHPQGGYGTYRDRTRQRVVRRLRKRKLLQLKRAKSGVNYGRNVFDVSAEGRQLVHEDRFAARSEARSIKRQREKRPRMKRGRR
jgi:hypothetical protein